MDNISSLVTTLLAQSWVDLLSQPARRFADLKNGKYPGVYLLAYSEKTLTGAAIVLEDVLYVGMSNSDGGVRQRLASFIYAIEHNKRHSGGNRFYRQYAKAQPFSLFATSNGGKKFYATSLSLECQTRKQSRTATDLEIMGEVARLEYYVIAYIKKHTSMEPALNES